MFCCYFEERHAHQSDCRRNGQRSNEAKENSKNTSESNHDLEQWRDHYGALNLMCGRKIDRTNDCLIYRLMDKWKLINIDSDEMIRVITLLIRHYQIRSCVNCQNYPAISNQWPDMDGFRDEFWHKKIHNRAFMEEIDFNVIYKLPYIVN